METISPYVTFKVTDKRRQLAASFQNDLSSAITQ